MKGRADPVDDRCRRSQLVRCKGDEVRLQLVEVAELRLRERTLEEGRHQHADRPEQLCGVRIQLERLPAVIRGQKADATVLAHERQHKHAADPVGLRNSGWQASLGRDVADEDQIPRLERALEDPPVVEAR